MIRFLDLGPTTEEITGEVAAGWDEVLRTGRFIGGPFVDEFERGFAEYCGTAHAIGVANGTDALHLALRAMDIGPDDEVVVPTNTFVATAEAVVLAGAVPRFADVDNDTLLLTPETLRAAVTPSTKAVVVVHLYGQMADMDALGRTTAELDIKLIEDAAQAQGARWRDVRAGAWGSVGCFSFYPGKNLGAFGDAGAVVTSDGEIAERIRSIRDHGRANGGHYQHDRFGVNSRLDALQAVVLAAKLPLLDGWNAQRRELADHYRRCLDPDGAKLVTVAPEAEAIHHLAVAQVRNRDQVREALLARGIETGIHYPTPCHRLPPYASYFGNGALPVSEAAAERIVSLPLYPHMTMAQVETVAAELNHVVERGAAA
ncbi:MAG TPA: DegT/DnrJ/EryC1/StrS family aminotransferase [Nocardioidaceae bacterium]|nr:DegT/DnrJ/EryC1/StrS family aminotransferase [Nocardioidaceae bacterium]